MSVNLSGTATKTICPGTYSSIKVSGGATLTLEPGAYIIEGGGLTVTGNASISGNGVLIFNAGRPPQQQPGASSVSMAARNVLDCEIVDAVESQNLTRHETTQRAALDRVMSELAGQPARSVAVCDALLLVIAEQALLSSEAWEGFADKQGRHECLKRPNSRARRPA